VIPGGVAGRFALVIARYPRRSKAVAMLRMGLMLTLHP